MMRASIAMAVLLMAFVPVNAEEPMIVAHRGASRDAPENTIPAFKLAWKRGADAIEGDFHLTTDGHIVCTHDGIGKKTLAELRALHAARYRGAFKGTTIPTIAEVFSTIPDKKKIFIEIKCGPEIIPALLEEIRKSGLKREQIVVISFNANVLKELKAKAPWIKTSWLCGFSHNKASGVTTPSLEKVIETLKSIKAGAISSSASMPDEFVGPIKKLGYEWHVWTVNDPAQARKIKALGVASITTDVPGLMKKQLAPPKPGRGNKILPAGAEIFTCQGKTAYLALPKKTVPGKKTPWLWYCPSDYKLPGKLEQWMINKCLANGIAVAGINVKGDFGTPAGRKIFTAFYNEVTQKHGLTKKVCMLARSYGGTQMYNWAAEHPESIACLAGIYPVCNLASYPGLKSAAGKYGMSQEQFVKVLKEHNPIDRLAPLAKAKVPIYHNIGDVDTLVPGKDNSFLLAKRYKALGGDITVTVFKGQGHNYWRGFFEDEAMAAFIIKHAKRVASLPKVLIIGDSISGGYSKSLTKLMEGKAEIVKLGAVATYRINKEAFWHSSGKAKALDFGSAKACIADFERFEKHLQETKYDVIHFNFGLNDIFRGRKGAWHNPVDQYAKDLAKIVALLKTNGAKIIWANITPIPANAPYTPEGDDLIYNAAAAKVMKENDIPINDLHSVVTNWDGYAKWKKGNDVHFGGGVYLKLAEQIAEKITAALVEKSAAEKKAPRLSGKSTKPRRVVLTFDDACKSNATFVAPLLKKHGFKGTFFISEAFSFTSRKDIYMTWEEIRKLHDEGFEIGNHTKSHHDMRKLSEEAIDSEIGHIEAQCKKHGIPKPTTFAYPGYHTSKTVVKVLKERGYKFARTGGAKASRPGKDDPLLLPDVLCPTPKTTFDELKKAADRADDKHIPIFTFHGVPDTEHGWVSTRPEMFEKFMQYLNDNGFEAIALRDYPANQGG